MYDALRSVDLMGTWSSVATADEGVAFATNVCTADALARKIIMHLHRQGYRGVRITGLSKQQYFVGQIPEK